MSLAAWKVCNTKKTEAYAIPVACDKGKAKVHELLVHSAVSSFTAIHMALLVTHYLPVRELFKNFNGEFPHAAYCVQMVAIGGSYLRVLMCCSSKSPKRPSNKPREPYDSWDCWNCSNGTPYIKLQKLQSELQDECATRCITIFTHQAMMPPP